MFSILSRIHFSRFSRLFLLSFAIFSSFSLAAIRAMYHFLPFPRQRSIFQSNAILPLAVSFKSSLSLKTLSTLCMNGSNRCQWQFILSTLFFHSRTHLSFCPFCQKVLFEIFAPFLLSFISKLLTMCLSLNCIYSLQHLHLTIICWVWFVYVSAGLGLLNIDYGQWILYSILADSIFCDQPNETTNTMDARFEAIDKKRKTTPRHLITTKWRNLFRLRWRRGWEGVGLDEKDIDENSQLGSDGK